MRRLLIAVGLWLLRVGGYEFPTPCTHTIDSVVQNRATALCAELEEVPQSSEFRRHQVFARLSKEFPNVSKRTISLAIEYGLPK